LLLLDVPILSFHCIELSTLSSVQLNLFFVHACDLLLHIFGAMLVILSPSLHASLTALCLSHVSCLTASEGQNAQVQYKEHDWTQILFCFGTKKERKKKGDNK
jgi:hypothetical protein